MGSRSISQSLEGSSSPEEVVQSILEQGTAAEDNLRDFIRNGLPVELDRIDTGIVDGQEFDIYQILVSGESLENLFFQWRAKDGQWYVSNSSDKGGRWEPIEDSDLLDNRNWY